MTTSPIEPYIATFPPEVQAVLRQVRAAVNSAAPQAEERISYRMPAVFQDGVVVYFAAFKKHIGLFPPVDDPKVQAKAAAYAGPKGNLQFPLDQPMPLELIAEIVGARLRANQAKAKGMQASKKPSAAKASGSGAVRPERARQDAKP